MLPDSLRKLRSAVCGVVWSRRQPLANAPAILNLLMGLLVLILLFTLCGLGFRMMRRYLAYCPEEQPRIFRMLD